MYYNNSFKFIFSKVNMVNRFVSVSGITNDKELEDVARIREEEKIETPVVIGYQVSHKSMHKGTTNSRQPQFSELYSLVHKTDMLGMHSAIHYYAKSEEVIKDDLMKIKSDLDTGMLSPALLQFNTLPPSPEIMQFAKDLGFYNIFKVAVSHKQTPDGGYAVWKGEEVQDVSNGFVRPLLNQVRERMPNIDYVMFDPSHGTNLELDLTEDSLARRFGTEIVVDPDFKDVGLVYAGGINPNNVSVLNKTLCSFFTQKRVSLDIESGIRPKNNKYDSDSVRGYLRNYEDSLRK
mgnify:CR=1 FL=1